MPAVTREQFGPYAVYEQLGIGGMAEVHRAEIDSKDGYRRTVALKRMLPHVAGNDDMVAAFLREARLASHLRHQNVAQTYELGQVDGIYFIAMELITGRNLREILKHCAVTNSGPMPVPIALHILNQICDALDYAHNLADETGQPLGIIHRDVTPSNIIVSHDGVVKLIDFGIAKASAAGMQTMSGTLKGKFGYMAPEYIAGSIDARADLFAIGVIAHELLTNRPLFTGRDDLETLTRVQKMDVQPPSRRNPSVPPEVDDIVMTALSRDPDRRWQHATALRTVLGTITRRLGLVATNRDVTDWIESAFDGRTKPRIIAAPTVALTLDGQPVVDHSDEPSVSISINDGASQALSSSSSAAISAQFGMQTPVTLPSGTPARITAQRSIPPDNAGATIPMQQALQPTPIQKTQRMIPELGLQASEVIRQSSPQIALPRTVTPQPPVPTQRISGLQPTARSSSPHMAGSQVSSPHAKTLFQGSGSIPIPQMPVQPVGSIPPYAPPPPGPSSGAITAPRPMPTPMPEPTPPQQLPMGAPPKRGGWLLPALLVLVVAAAAGVVVYFVLPRLT